MDGLLKQQIINEVTENVTNLMVTITNEDLKPVLQKLVEDTVDRRLTAEAQQRQQREEAIQQEVALLRYQVTRFNVRNHEAVEAIADLHNQVESFRQEVEALKKATTNDRPAQPGDPIDPASEPPEPVEERRREPANPNQGQAELEFEGNPQPSGNWLERKLRRVIRNED